MASMSGTIKRLVRDKGFGFISAGGAEEYFFHSSACTGMRFDDLREGQQVSFDVGRGPKGPRAENVRVEYRAAPPVVPAEVRPDSRRLKPTAP
jgi:CspA family cold shock protein